MNRDCFVQLKDKRINGWSLGTLVTVVYPINTSVIKKNNMGDSILISYSSSDSRPGMYSKLTSKITGLFGATLGLPGAELRPFGNANCYRKNQYENRKRMIVTRAIISTKMQLFRLAE